MTIAALSSLLHSSDGDFLSGIWIDDNHEHEHNYIM